MAQRKLVAVAIFHHCGQLRWYERISLTQAANVLQRHPIYFVCPENTEIGEVKAIAPNLQFVFVPKSWMNSVRNYNRMKILPHLYQKFSDYQFMLTHELDAFVFRDELEKWCNKGFDYIGAPWILGVDQQDGIVFDSGGNSGFSLRNVQSVLKAMKRCSLVENPFSAAKRTYRQRQSIARAAIDLVMFSTVCTTHPWLNFYRKHEDRFWSTFGARADWFNLATPEESVEFSFEKEPERLYQLNNRKLPFGCHAWQKYAPEFWRGHIEELGYSWGDH